MTLGIGKQRELPKRPGDWRSSKGDMNKVPDSAQEEAEELRRRFPESGKPAVEAPAQPATKKDEGGK